MLTADEEELHRLIREALIASQELQAADRARSLVGTELLTNKSEKAWQRWADAQEAVRTAELKRLDAWELVRKAWEAYSWKKS